MCKTSMKEVDRLGDRQEQHDYVYGWHAEILRKLTVFAFRSGVRPDFHETELTVKLKGGGFVDNACPSDFTSKNAEPFLELRNQDGEKLCINVAELLACVAGPALEAMHLHRAVQRVEQRKKGRS